MKKATLLLFLVLTVNFGFGQTILNTGDVAITGANAGIPGDGTDQFSFVLLTDVVSSTEINFTDGGWLSAGGFNNFNAVTGEINGEGIVTWTAPIGGLLCGTEIIIKDIGSNTWSADATGIADAGTAEEVDDIGFDLSSDGDQILVFQGLTNDPTFLFALHFATNTSWTDALDTNSSAIPSGLTDGVNALTRNLDNIVYKYNVTGNKSSILAAIVDPAEWIASNTSFQTLGLPTGASFTCSTTILEEGDIAITGVNTDNPDEFSFVLLTDVVAGTEVNFTDCGWLGAGQFRDYNFTDPSGGTTAEGILKWTATNDLNCGTEIIIEETSAGSNTYTSTSGGTIEGIAIEIQDEFALSSQGDQIITFQGTITAPKFLYALNFASNIGFTDPIDPNPDRKSSVPAGLTEGLDAVSLDAINGQKQNVVYNYSVTDNQSLILVAMANLSNWSGYNNSQTLGIANNGGTIFSCTPDGACFGTVTWNNGVWSGTPSISTNVEIKENYTTSAGNFNACSLTIDPDATLTVADGTFIIVENDVTINGDLIVETSGNFIQNNDNGTFSGVANLFKITPTKDAWYYYTFWSSPMASTSIGSVFGDVPSDRRFTFNAANFVDNSPTDGIDDNGDVWGIMPGGNAMEPGVAYLTTSSKSGTFPREDTIEFEGTFNTGDIEVDITFDPTNLGARWNFIGNPYPGAIDLVAFHLANDDVLDGIAYFWSQDSELSTSNPGNSQSNVNQDDYAMYSVGAEGGTAGGSTVTPNGYIASGQGFFIPANANLNQAAIATFTNSMRVADGTSNNQFFKSSNSKKSSVRTVNPLVNRLWVNLTTDHGAFQQILVAYVDKATDNYDGLSYDAPKILSSGYSASLYSKIENNDTRYGIQCKAINSITENEIIKLGFINAKVNEDIPFKLSIAQFEGSFLTDNPIYLKDNLLNTIHNLSDSDYSFTSGIGEYSSRFEIVFSAQSLSTDDNILDSSTLKIIQLDNDNVQFTVSDNLSIKSVSIFDLLGRELYSLKGTSSSETYKLSNLQNAIYIAKVELSNGAIITKKALKK